MRIRRPQVIPGNCWELNLRNDGYETRFVLCCDQTFTEHGQTHELDLNLAKYVLRYLKGTREQCL